MNKCWFVLEQSFYTPPQYATPTKAAGITVRGDLRLGDVVPSPKNIYPILTQGTLPLFRPDMRISSSQLCQFSWDTTKERENSETIGAGAPIAVAAGITVNVEFSAMFKKTMKSWAKFKTVDTETVQPNRTYIDQVLAKTDVQDHIEQYKLPFLNQWTVFVVTGLMIARAGGTIGTSESASRIFSGGPDVDALGALNVKLHNYNRGSTENNKSAELQGDRVWAVRFAKVHKGLLCRKWMQTEATIGAALDGGEEEEEKVREVLNNEGFEGVEIIDMAAEDGMEQLVFVTGDF